MQQIQYACPCTHMRAHTHKVMLIHQVHTSNLGGNHTSHFALSWGTQMHTHWEEARLGQRRREGSRPGCRDGDSAGGGDAGSELLFTTQSPSVVIATQPPNRETDITASPHRGGRAGGGKGGKEGSTGDPVGTGLGSPTGARAAAEK